MKRRLFDKDAALMALLLLLSFSIYFFYYGHLILNLNTVLFDIEGDSIKNYYTYVHHVKNDKSLLTFSGLNYPFGEHVVYTDCQPLLTLILKALPFTHDHLIGILHGLILLSFMITPLILFRIFRLSDVNPHLSFFSALAIALLSPQIQRLGGHFALAYGCVIPLGALLLLRHLIEPGGKRLILLFLYNTLLFFVHPYFGLGLSLFCLLTLLIAAVFTYTDKITLYRKCLTAVVPGLFPVLTFKFFMLLTDTHLNRPDEPYGVDIMGAAANPESVFTPSFGPFVGLLKSIIKDKHVEWESLSYIGIFSLTFMLISALLIPFYIKKTKFWNSLTAMFISSVIFLLISFGKHIELLGFFNIEISTLNQFRAFGRFAWYFYFLLPVFLITAFSNFAKTLPLTIQKTSLLLLAILFFCFNLLESHYLLKGMTNNTFRSRNIFNKRCLTNAETRLIDKIKTNKFQAILPLPLFHIGSEVYQRNGEKSVAPAMIYSYHTGLPVLSVMLSRTSLNESETELEILNRYKKEKKIIDLIRDDALLVIKTGNSLKKDELRLLKNLQPFDKNDSQEFFSALKFNLSATQSEKDSFVQIDALKKTKLKNVVYIGYENRKPFTETKINSYETIVDIDSTELEPGNYTLSFHYHLKQKKFRYIHNNLIVVKKNPGEDQWVLYTSVRSTSGFYDDFIVFEEKIRFDKNASYQILLNGPMKEKYKVSDFLLKPEDLDVKIISNGHVSYNNYPE